MKTIPILVAIGILALSGIVLADDTAKSPSIGVEEKTQACFQCQGKGMSKCTIPTCKDGQMNCPAPCLKPNDGTWVHLVVEGHPPTDTWKKFYKKDGTYAAWNQAHAGEVVAMQNGEPVNIGKCTGCSGTTKVKCTGCKGTGQTICPMCAGKKVVPQSWSAFDNPKLKNRPSRFTLKDGRVLIGRKTMVLGTSATIKTEKDTITVPTADIVSEEKQPSAK